MQKSYIKQRLYTFTMHGKKLEIYRQQQQKKKNLRKNCIKVSQFPLHETGDSFGINTYDYFNVGKYNNINSNFMNSSKQ